MAAYDSDKTLSNSEISHDDVNIVSKNDENFLSTSEVMLDLVNNENVLKDDDAKVIHDITNDESFSNAETEVSSSTTSPLVLYLHPNIQNNEENSISVQQNTSEERPYLCNICDKTFKRKNHYSIHLYTHNTERPCICKTCNKAFTHHYFLKQHEKLHNTEKEFTCPYCNEQFSVRRYYTRHLRIHRKRTYECDACDFKCCWLKDSIAHIKSHDCKLFTCSKCDRCFTQETNLNLHDCFNSDVKRYSCKYCSKTFRRIHNLDPHIAVHENKKLFICQICDRGFNTKQSLRAHTLRYHKEQNEHKPYACQVCGKKFHLQVNLKRHEKFHERKPIKSGNPVPSTDSIPIHEFQSRVNQRASGAIAAYLNIESPISEQKLVYIIPGKKVKCVCNICLKGFTNQHALTVHYRRHTGDKPFKCTFCTWGFADPADLRRHYRTHIADVKYCCKHCDKHFTRKAYMTAHFRTCPHRNVPKVTSVFSIKEESV